MTGPPGHSHTAALCLESTCQNVSKPNANWNYLQFPLLFLHDSPDDGEGGVNKTQHEQQGELVLDGHEKGVRDERRVREPLCDHGEVLEQLVCGGVCVVLHDGSVHGVLHSQEAFSDVP